MEKSQVHIGQTVEFANGRRATVTGVMLAEEPPATVLVRFFTDDGDSKREWVHPGDLTLVQTD